MSLDRDGRWLAAAVVTASPVSRRRRRVGAGAVLALLALALSLPSSVAAAARHGEASPGAMLSSRAALTAPATTGPVAIRFHRPDSGFTRATASPAPNVDAAVQASTPAMPSPQAGSGAPSPAAILGPVPRLTPVVEGTAPASVPVAWPWLAVILILATALVVVVGLRLRREADLGREL